MNNKFIREREKNSYTRSQKMAVKRRGERGSDMSIETDASDVKTFTICSSIREPHQTGDRNS